MRTRIGMLPYGADIYLSITIVLGKWSSRIPCAISYDCSIRPWHADKSNLFLFRPSKVPGNLDCIPVLFLDCRTVPGLASGLGRKGVLT
jgi:hypothetical protein